MSDVYHMPLKERGPYGRSTNAAQVAQPPLKEDNREMDYVPRPELDAKLQAIEARLEGRVARIEDAVQRIADSTKEIRDENRAVQTQLSGLKTTIVTSAIGAVLAIVLGIAAFNATLTSNMLSAFQAGLQNAPQSQSAKPPTE